VSIYIGISIQTLLKIMERHLFMKDMIFPKE